MKKIVSLFLCVTLFGALCVGICCAEETEAQDLRRDLALTHSAGQGTSRLLDGNHNTYLSVGTNTSLLMQSEVPIASLYIEFDRIPGTWTLTDMDSGAEYTCGQDGFLHEYINVASLCGSAKSHLALTFNQPNGASIADIYVYSDGTLPETVQIWEAAEEEADLLLVVSHSDDDQLFFAGLLPTYTARGLEVQVAFFTNHWDTHDRPHESLNGLWHTGVTRYPIISDFPDQYSESALQAEEVLSYYGYDRESVLEWQVGLLRRFRPLVVVGHDLKGEYGHGAHMYSAEILVESLSLAADEAYTVGSYPTWEVPRLYLHLYEERTLTMEYDVPLPQFDGKTAFEVSKEAFGCHKSQHWTWFADWIDKSSAAEIRSYSPCKFGLYTTKDASIPQDGDLFFGMKTYRELEEEERLRQEEADRLAAEEEAKRQEALQEALREEERLENEQKETNTGLKKELSWAFVALGASLIVLIVLTTFIVLRSKKRAMTFREGKK